MERQGKYVYCVIRGSAKKSFGSGFDGNPVHTLPYKDISAVVSDTSPVEYEPNEANALMHEGVVERVMQEYTVLPLGFGNVFINESRVKWLLARFYPTFRTCLKKLEGKVEVGVKVFYDLEVAKCGLETPDVGVDEEDEDPARRVFEENDRINEKAYEYGVKIDEELKKHAEDMHLMKRIGENMILNTALLIEKERIEDFKTEIGRLEEEYADKGLKIQFSGPWPPYNFVRIHINA